MIRILSIALIALTLAGCADTWTDYREREAKADALAAKINAMPKQPETLTAWPSMTPACQAERHMRAVIYKALHEYGQEPTREIEMQLKARDVALNCPPLPFDQRWSVK